VGLLDGILGFLGRSRTLPHLRTAKTFGSAVVAYLHSPWTRARNMIAIACLVVLFAFLAPRSEQPASYSAMALFGSFGALSFLLRAIVLAPWGESGGLPSNKSLERTREG
jgi:hypothetical protein